MSELLRKDLAFILDTLKIEANDPVRDTLRDAPTEALPQMFLEFSKALKEITGSDEALKHLKFKDGEKIISYDDAMKKVADENYKKNNPQEKRSVYVSAENGSIRIPSHRSRRTGRR
jgi:hypothetical protein